MILWFWFLIALVSCKKAQITEFTKASDVLEFEECRHITSDEINVLLHPFACRGFKATCLNQFNLREINGACKDRLNPYEVNKLSVRKFEELIGSDNAMNIACFPESIHVFHMQLKSYPKTFMHLCRTDERWLRQFSIAVRWNDVHIPHNTRPKHIDEFMTLDNAAGLSETFFDYIPLSEQSVFSPALFPHWTQEQFGRLNARRFQVSQIRQTPAELFSSYPNASRLAVHDTMYLNAISADQAAHWGRDPRELPKKNPARRTFYLSHPCTYVKPLLYRFRSDTVVKAVKKRCRPLWKHKDFPNFDIGKKALLP